MTDQPQPTRTADEVLAEARLRRDVERLTEERDEARGWARHGYEIGQRSTLWSDHGVAPAWLTEGWPNHFDADPVTKLLSQLDELLTAHRAALADQLGDGRCDEIPPKILGVDGTVLATYPCTRRGPHRIHDDGRGGRWYEETPPAPERDRHFTNPPTEGLLLHPADLAHLKVILDAAVPREPGSPMDWEGAGRRFAEALIGFRAPCTCAPPERELRSDDPRAPGCPVHDPDGTPA